VPAGLRWCCRRSKDNVVYFYSPSDLAAKSVEPGVALRIGGLVAQGSVTRGPGAEVHFVVDRRPASRYRLPTPACSPIFSAKGKALSRQAHSMRGGVFAASENLAKPR